MNPTTIRRIVLGMAGLAVAAGAAVMAQQAVEKPRHTRAEFMRMKLEHAKNVLEGLALEDYDSISKNAKALKRISEAAEWELPTIPDAGDYVIYTTEFQRLMTDMDRKAKERNIDGATLAYLRMTMNCVTCHKYVRQITK